jgi:hypothetical protein
MTIKYKSLKTAVMEWKIKCQGIHISTEDINIYSLNFADYQILVAEDHYDTKYMTKKT